MIDWLKPDHQDPKIAVGGQDMPIQIRRNARAKRMTMRLSPDGQEIRITLPQWGRTKEALAFAEKRLDWLEKQLAKLPKQTPVGPAHPIIYRGENLAINWEKSLPRTPIIEDGALRFGGPESALPGRLRRWLESEALRLLSDDLAFYCARDAREDVPQLRLSRAQRRWGSCSGKGDLRVNWRLIQAPDHVRKSVVAHEVTHLTHFDHSPAFHAHLARIYEGNIHDADTWLSAHGRSLYAQFG